MEKEKPVVSYGVAKVSEASLGGKSDEFKDGYYVDEKLLFFAIFDGIDADKGSEYATKVAVDATEKILASYEPPRTANHLCWMLEKIDKKIREDKYAGGTSATLMRVIEDVDGLRLIFASIGDSRIYMRRGGEVFQMTIDDSLKSKDLDAMKITDPEKRMEALETRVKRYLNSPNGFEVSYNNSGEIAFEKGDRVLMCTDSISGRKKEERLGIEDIAMVFSKELEDRLTAEVFVKVARKIDDRIAIVIGAR